ncbi:MAG: TfoX/Sxy family DNA transformation protein [Planctomycetes bacterium]|nr:TfoX/Sxy family DNA transformation protein [Planctomycetota bacterium]
MATEHEAHIIERLERVIAVRTRAMFGGIGIYCDAHFFALIANDVLYFKVDDDTRPEFEARGMEPFQPFPDKPSMMSYFALPPDVLDDPRRLKTWVEKSLQVARAAKPRRLSPGKSKARPARSTAKLLNLGPVSLRMLREIGVESRADLERLGSVRAFKAVEKQGHKPSILLLYALEGALLDLRWDRLPDVVKRDLRKRAGRD